MRARLMLATVLAVGALIGCETNTITNVTITGPFERCTVIILPNGRVVSFGEAGVTVRDGNTIDVGGVSYTIDFSSCAAATTLGSDMFKGSTAAWNGAI